MSRRVLDAEAIAARRASAAPFSHSEVLNLSAFGASALELAEELSTLRRLNVDGNKLSRLATLHKLPRLTWLSASNNKLVGAALADAGCLKELVFAGFGHNSIGSIPPGALLSCASSLRALLLNDCGLVDLRHIAHLSGLNSLVASHNALTSISRDVLALSSITKLSLGHNRIETLPDLSSLKHLAELRLNDNRITTLPASLGACGTLRLVDLGNNQLASAESVAALGPLDRLVNLNLKGNAGVCAELGGVGSAEYTLAIRTLCPSLLLLDGSRLTRDGANAPKAPRRREPQPQHQQQQHSGERDNGSSSTSSRGEKSVTAAAAPKHQNTNSSSRPTAHDDTSAVKKHGAASSQPHHATSSKKKSRDYQDSISKGTFSGPPASALVKGKRPRVADAASSQQRHVDSVAAAAAASNDPVASTSLPFASDVRLVEKKKRKRGVVEDTAPSNVEAPATAVAISSSHLHSEGAATAAASAGPQFEVTIERRQRGKAPAASAAAIVSSLSLAPPTVEGWD